MSRTTRSGRRPRTPCAAPCIANNVEYYEAPGEAAFYGPKADFQTKDALGREWQTQHDPGGLHPARAPGLQVHRRGGQRADAGRAAPRRHGHDGAVPGRADRAVRGSVPVLARAAADRAHPDRRAPQRLRQEVAQAAAGGGLPGRSGRRATRRWASASAKTRCRRFP